MPNRVEKSTSLVQILFDIDKAYILMHTLSNFPLKSSSHYLQQGYGYMCSAVSSEVCNSHEIGVTPIPNLRLFHTKLYLSLISK